MVLTSFFRRNRLVIGLVMLVLIALSTLMLWRAKERSDERAGATVVSAGKTDPAKVAGSASAIAADAQHQPATNAANQISPSASANVPNMGIADLSKFRSSRELVEFVRRTNDVALQEYAIRSVAFTCKMLQWTTGRGKPHNAFGVANPNRTEQVLKRLMDESRTAAAPLRERCSDYESVDSLRSELVEESERAQLPLAKTGNSIGDLSRPQGYTEAAVGEARGNIEKLLAGSHPAAMVFSLSSSLSSAGRVRLALHFTATDANDWPLGPAQAAYHLAACRTKPLDCGSGTLERDTVCAKYGECQAPDVESSYRRLFDLYGIPFGDTDRLATKFQQAIANKDAATLLP
jgi:hypothetical protein